VLFCKNLHVGDMHMQSHEPGAWELFIDWGVGSKSRGPHFEESTNLL